MTLLLLYLFTMLYSSQQPRYSLPLFTTWYSFPTDLINLIQTYTNKHKNSARLALNTYTIWGAVKGFCPAKPNSATSRNFSKDLEPGMRVKWVPWQPVSKDAATSVFYKSQVGEGGNKELYTPLCPAVLTIFLTELMNLVRMWMKNQRMTSSWLF